MRVWGIVVLVCLPLHVCALVLNRQWISRGYFGIDTKTSLSLNNVRLLVSTYMGPESTLLERLLKPMFTHEQATPEFLYAYMLAKFLENISLCLELTCVSLSLSPPDIAPEAFNSLLTALFTHLEKYGCATLESVVDLIKMCGAHIMTCLPDKRTSDGFVAGMNMIIHGVIVETILESEREDFKSALYVLDRFYFERYYGAVPATLPNPAYLKEKMELMEMVQELVTAQKIVDEILLAMHESPTLKSTGIDCMVMYGILPEGMYDVPVSEQMLEDLLLRLDVLIPIH